MSMTSIRLALGLRSTAQSLGVIGRDCGVFARHGLALDIVREETTGPEGARCLLSGECDIAEFGAVPVVQAALEGRDPLILLAAEQVNALHLLGAKGVELPTALRDREVGVLSADGQTGVSARQMLERWNVASTARLTALGTYPRIYEALREGRVAAGVLTADYGIAGAVAHGFTLLADLGTELGFQAPVVATTRRFRERSPDVVQRVVDAYMETIQVFKHQRGAVLPSLVRHLGFVNEAQAASIHAFYAQRFQDAPYPSAEGLQRIVALLSNDHARQRAVALSDFYDPTFVRAACERGLIDRP